MSAHFKLDSKSSTAEVCCDTGLTTKNTSLFLSFVLSPFSQLSMTSACPGVVRLVRIWGPRPWHACILSQPSCAWRHIVAIPVDLSQYALGAMLF